MRLVQPADSGPPLRDIHVPEPGWWPPAPGWWMLAGLVVLLLLGAAWWLRRRWRLRRRRQWVALELERIEARFADDRDHARLAAAASRLLRRVVLWRRGRADLRGTAWHRELDRLAPGMLDADTVAVLESAPYLRQAAFDGPALVQACRRWTFRAMEGGHA